MGEVRRKTSSEVSDLLSLHREIRQRMSANAAEFAEANVAGDAGRMAHAMTDTLTMIQYASWIRRQRGYRAARLQLRPVASNGGSGHDRIRSVV